MSGGEMMEHDGDAMLGALRAMFDSAGIPVLHAVACDDRTFTFDIGGLLSGGQEAQLAAACHEKRVKVDVNAASSRYVIDGRER
jgi:hypothetical protein